jgi:hypothetical protein
LLNGGQRIHIFQGNLLAFAFTLGGSHRPRHKKESGLI